MECRLNITDKISQKKRCKKKKNYNTCMCKFREKWNVDDISQVK